jgi:hypothetical protein
MWVAFCSPRHFLWNIASCIGSHRRRRPQVVEPSAPQLGPGQIRDCNRALLAAAAQQEGAQVGAPGGG